MFNFDTPKKNRRAGNLSSDDSRLALCRVAAGPCDPLHCLLLCFRVTALLYLDVGDLTLSLPYVSVGPDTGLFHRPAPSKVDLVLCSGPALSTQLSKINSLSEIPIKQTPCQRHGTTYRQPVPVFLPTWLVTLHRPPTLVVHPPIQVAFFRLFTLLITVAPSQPSSLPAAAWLLPVACKAAWS